MGWFEARGERGNRRSRCGVDDLHRDVVDVEALMGGVVVEAARPLHARARRVSEPIAVVELVDPRRTGVRHRHLSGGAFIDDVGRRPVGREVGRNDVRVGRRHLDRVPGPGRHHGEGELGKVGIQAIIGGRKVRAKKSDLRGGGGVYVEVWTGTGATSVAVALVNVDLGAVARCDRLEGERDHRPVAGGCHWAVQPRAEGAGSVRSTDRRDVRGERRARTGAAVASAVAPRLRSGERVCVRNDVRVGVVVCEPLADNTPVPAVLKAQVPQGVGRGGCPRRPGEDPDECRPDQR